MKVCILPEAEEETQQAAHWYNEQRFGLGDEFLADLADSMASVLKWPESFAPVETLRNNPGFRRCILRRFPYAIVFRIRGDAVVVVAVAHTKRKPNYWKSRDV